MTTTTTYGTVTRDERGTEVRGTADELSAWARNPYAAWPCSTLARLPHGIVASFDLRGDLVDLSGVDGYDVPADELGAWSSEVLTRAGYFGHPAIRH